MQSQVPTQKWEVWVTIYYIIGSKESYGKYYLPETIVSKPTLQKQLITEELNIEHFNVFKGD